MGYLANSQQNINVIETPLSMNFYLCKNEFFMEQILMSHSYHK